MAEVKTIESVKIALSEILHALQFPFNKIEVSEEGGNIIRANIDTERAPFLIGTFGERINALQHLLKNYLWKKEGGEGIFLIVDVDGYKKSREEKMILLAEEKAEAARLTGVPQKMPILEPYLRRLVHLRFVEDSEVKTESRGDGTERRLWIVVSGKS